MTIYLGETILFAHTATSDGVVLNDTNTDEVTFSLFDSAYAEELIGPTAMAWSSINSRWELAVPTGTGGLTEAGKYNIRIAVITSTTTNWEYFKVTIKANPAAAFGVI